MDTETAQNRLAILSLNRRNFRHRHFDSVDNESVIGTIQTYLECLTGRPHLTGSSEATNAIAYIAYIKGRLKWISASPFAPLKGSPLPPNSFATDKQVFEALTELAAAIKENSQWSVNDGINSLAAAGVFRVDLSAEDVVCAAHIVFVMSGWITMLFTPQIPTSDAQDGLQVDITGTKQFLTPTQPIEKADRPLVEVLKGFGEILPVCGQETSSFDAGVVDGDTLEVANLNLATLINIGRINIVWPSSTAVFILFAFILPVESGQQHTILIFADDSQARSIFHKEEKERARIARGTPTEPYLDKLCGEKSPYKSYLPTFGSPLTVSYSKSRDFPYLAGRLSDLQSYIRSQQPNRLTALWYDRRNLLSWYTFWTVLVFGVVGISCSIIQTILGMIQTVIAWKTYQAQLASVQSP
ncbi:hypothetical protein N7528_008857 [Penicillium herquei]|nr:hypothetical protein N7528_008857 [Penicillium herquei]